ncbi:flagellar biosynthesis anti-sigma factor FlgM [Paenibacillus sp. HJGM_3]|uniref:flagellar biosynthesis anti-sigma factor FlgM n=1 Tax=Paenibacillus sp. HJGM_3 TaxID=3379816 RepID=UPI00385D3833
MKINGIHSVGGTNPYNRNQETRTSEWKSAREKQKDEVRISSEAQELLEAQGSPDAQRLQKLQELKQSVSTGTYHVEAGKIAEKLLPYLKS